MPPKPRLPRARFNAASFKLQTQGFTTMGQLSDLTGVPPTTLDYWEGLRLPKFERINGIRVVRPEQLPQIVEQCKKLRSSQ